MNTITTTNNPDFDLNLDNYNFNEILNLFKIHDIGSDDKKYYKYKAKYLESKDIDVNNDLITYKQIKKDNEMLIASEDNLLIAASIASATMFIVAFILIGSKK